MKIRYEWMIVITALLVLFRQNTPLDGTIQAPGATVKDSAVYTVYLTLDDGPLPGTRQLFQAVTTEQVKINVFLVGRNMEKMPDSAVLLAAYHQHPFIEPGNHSYSHAGGYYNRYYRNPSGVLADFIRNEKQLGLRSRIARLPGRNIWRLPGLRRQDLRSGASAADSLYNNGFLVFGWDLEWKYDTASFRPLSTAPQLIEEMALMLRSGKTARKNQIVILAHDEMLWQRWSLEQLQQLMRALKTDGRFRLAHLSQYNTRDQ